LADDTLVLHDAVAIDGLTAGVYRLAPWRSWWSSRRQTGTVAFEGLMNAVAS